MEINPLEQNVGLNMVLLGKTGAGKSATGNTILGRQAFISKKSPKSVTQDVAVASGTVCGSHITVYDTPGFCDTELSEGKIQQKFQSVFQECESGPCVYLLVIKADRFTAEEQNTVKKIEKLLGQNRLQKTWILFTRGDELEDMTIEDFINDAEPLKKHIQKYEGRYHVLNNKNELVDQVKILVGKLRHELNKLLSRGVNKLKEISGKSHKNLPRRKFVLLGKTGVGKSAAGNTILGENAFISKLRAKSVTTKCRKKHATVAGRKVSVVDTPGFFDTSMDLEILVPEIARSIIVSSPGPHAFLIVFPVNQRFTEQEQQIIEQIQTLFGEDVFKYSIILFTHGDQLKGKSIEKLIQENPELGDLVRHCGGRYHVFNNEDTGDREQVSDLLQKIDTMIEENGGGHYTSEMYEQVERIIQEEKEKSQREEERQREIGEQEKKQREEELERERKKMKDECDLKIAELKSQLERIKGESQKVVKSKEEEKQEENVEEEEEEKNKKKEQEELSIFWKIFKKFLPKIYAFFFGAEHEKRD